MCCAKWIDLIPWEGSAPATSCFKRKKNCFTQKFRLSQSLTILQPRDDLGTSVAALHSSCHGPEYIPWSGANGIPAQFLWESPHFASGPQFLIYKILAIDFPSLPSIGAALGIPSSTAGGCRVGPSQRVSLPSPEVDPRDGLLGAGSW